MNKPSADAVSRIMPLRLDLERIMCDLEGLDPEQTSAAEMYRCKTIVAQLRSAIQELHIPGMPTQKAASTQTAGKQSDVQLAANAIAERLTERANKQKRWPGGATVSR
jgi:hypothetical protein